MNNSIIAIMLGRLEMDVDECIQMYTGLIRSIFDDKSKGLPFHRLKPWKLKGRFDSAKLEKAIKSVLTGSGNSEKELLNDNVDRRCKV